MDMKASSADSSLSFVEMLRLRRQLQRGLDPVAPPDGMVARIRQQLDANIEQAKDTYRREQRKRKRMRIIALLLGVIAYIIGLGFMGYRLIRQLRGKG